jgi:hypothetical protein
MSILFLLRSLPLCHYRMYHYPMYHYRMYHYPNENWRAMQLGKGLQPLVETGYGCALVKSI